MSKIAFNKFGLKKQDNINTVIYNEQEIEVKQYLPINDKLRLMTDVLNSIVDNNNFVNYMKLNMALDLFIVRYYTNINFTDKQLEDPLKLYDLMKENGFFDVVKSGMDKKELDIIIDTTTEITEGYYHYKDSVYGIIENLKLDNETLTENAEKIRESINDPQALGLVKDVLTKLG